MPSGLLEADMKSQSEKKKPEFVRASANGSLEPMQSHKSQSALLELPHKAILRSDPKASEDKGNVSRSLMEKAHELHNRAKENNKNKGSQLSIGNRAHRVMQNDMDLPAIEEAADKENDTFAQGGPLAGLARKKSIDRSVSRSRSGIRSAQSA